MSRGQSSYPSQRYSKYKKIRKPFEPKSASLLPSYSSQEDLFDSEEEQRRNRPPLINKGSTKVKEKSGSHDSWFGESSSEESQSEFESSMEAPLCRLEGLRSKVEPIFKAEAFQQVQEIDFELYTTLLAQTRIYGALLCDEFGRILWCDKTSHELLEGSLNNFTISKLTHFMLASKMKDFLQEMSSIRDYNSKTTLQWIIYSKNSKRRFFQVPLPSQPSPKDIFYRFLKHLTVRVRPIEVNLPHYRDPNGFCNEMLVPKIHPQKCFFLQLRHAKRAPNINHLNLLNDIGIKKFISNTKAKHIAKHQGTSRAALQFMKQASTPSTRVLTDPNLKEQEEGGPSENQESIESRHRRLDKKGTKESQRKKGEERRSVVG